MKEQELLLKEIALMLDRQDMLSKLTESSAWMNMVIPKPIALTLSDGWNFQM